MKSIKLLAALITAVMTFTGFTGIKDSVNNSDSTTGDKGSISISEEITPDTMEGIDGSQTADGEEAPETSEEVSQGSGSDSLKDQTVVEDSKDNTVGNNTSCDKVTDSETNNNNNNNMNNTVPETNGQASSNNGSQNESNEGVTESNAFLTQVQQEIFSIVNQERAKAGMQPLSYNSTMEKYAQIKSRDMGDNNYFSHEDLSGNLITVKMKNDGVSYSAWGENIAYIGGNTSASTLASQFMNNWMNSSGHRANILSSNFNSIGIGVYKIGNKVYATQEFYR